jgi:hypothetical protein
MFVKSIFEYLVATEGNGILATAGDDGRVTATVHAKPHMVDENTVAFIMADRLSYCNLQSNPHAAYLFMEDGSKYTGMRLFLSKIKEETDAEKLNSVRTKSCPEFKDEKEYLVSFRIDQVLPPIGPE